MNGYAPHERLVKIEGRGLCVRSDYTGQSLWCVMTISNILDRLDFDSTQW